MLDDNDNTSTAAPEVGADATPAAPPPDASDTTGAGTGDTGDTGADTGGGAPARLSAA
jgi:hypothetical protein